MSIKHNDVDTDGVSVSSYSGDSAAVVDNSPALKLNKKITRRDFFRSTGVLYAASTMVDVKHARAGDDDDEDSPPPTSGTSKPEYNTLDDPLAYRDRLSGPNQEYIPGANQKL